MRATKPFSFSRLGCANNGNTNLDTGAYLFETFGHLAAETVKADEEVVVEVEDVIDFLLGDTQDVALNDRVDIEESEEIISLGHLVARNFTGHYTRKY